MSPDRDDAVVLPHHVRLVVVFGGRSAEHEVSCVTAACVIAAVDRARYDVVPVGVTPDGHWVRAEEAEGALVAEGPPIDPFDVLAGPTTVALPLLHGPFGEDGTAQGLFEMVGVPYVGCGVLASALAMDKAMAKEVLDRAGLPVARALTVRGPTHAPGLADRIDAELGWPVFVKPANLGSSIGISKVHDRNELGDALTLADGFDEWIVIEEMVSGQEVECAVLGNLDPSASVMGEIVPSHEFYDFDDKYGEQGAELMVPADVPVDVSDEARAIAVRAFEALRCEGMARVDFFYDRGGRGLVINEVNTIPGFTPISMYPRLWESSGVPYVELIDRLVMLALDRHRRRAGRIGRARTG
jgi:D-alanine-D-alanine ligase